MELATATATALLTWLTGKGIGSLLKPLITRLDGEQATIVAANRARLIAQAEHDAEEIRAGRLQVETRGRLFLATSTGPALPEPQSVPETPLPIAQLVAEAFVADQLQREANLGRAILVAIEELETRGQEGAASNAPPDAGARVDDDWLYRWRDYTAGTHSKTLQSLWGRLLAGEFIRPGEYSVRTLEFVKNLSTGEAKLIDALGSFAADGNRYVPYDLKVLFEHSITYEQLMELASLGILGTHPHSPVPFNLASAGVSTASIVLSDIILLVERPTPDFNPMLPTMPITALGQQLLRLGHYQFNEAMFCWLVDFYKEQGAKVSVADCMQLPDGTFRWSNAKEL